MLNTAVSGDIMYSYTMYLYIILSFTSASFLGQQSLSGEFISPNIYECFMDNKYLRHV